MNLPCPACGYSTIGEDTYGTYNICPVCGWEDDGVQLANPASGGGANRESLIEAQEQALVDHPFEDQSPFQGFTRDPRWRPLNEDEISKALHDKEESYWKNRAVLYPSDAYWSRNG